MFQYFYTIAFPVILMVSACGPKTQISERRPISQDKNPSTQSPSTQNPSTQPNVDTIALPESPNTRIPKAANEYAADKWFSGKNSSAEFFNCLQTNGVDHYIATYNPNLTGGSDVDFHLDVAERSGMGLSAYYAWNNETGLTDYHIDQFINKISQFPIHYIFIDIETAAGRNTDDYVYELYQRVCVQEGFSCGIYTNYGGMSNANYPKSYKTPLNEMPLWFADGSRVHEPNRQFDSPFYGWDESHGRQIYINETYCDEVVDISVFEPGFFSGVAI